MKKTFMIIVFVFSFSLLGQEEEVGSDLHVVRAPAEEAKSYEQEMEIELGLAEEDHEETVDDLEP